jgi:RecA-family ATPase
MPPIEWMIESIIPQNSLSVMYGEPGAGKSFLALDMALSVAYGRPWHGKAVMPGSILYIAGEGVGGLGKRVAAWQAFYGVDPVAPFHVLPTAVRFREPEDVEKLMRTIDSFNTQFSCVFVDTVARALLGGDENSALTWACSLMPATL